MRAAAAVLVLLLLPSTLRAQAAPACAAADACQAARHAGEVGIVLLGDSGYGQGGSAEWGPHSQAAVAASLEALCPRPDLVFFLGDNIYWGGSPTLFGPRFDTMYPALFDAEHRRVHAALGNHDVKGCTVSAEPGFAAGETCLDALQRAVRDDVQRDVSPGAPASAQAAHAAETAERGLDPDVESRATRVPAADCPPAFDAAYEQAQAGGEGGNCYAAAALRHSQFGFLRRGQTPLRYYTVDWPGAASAAAAGATVASDPRVRVLVADSNTLDVVGSYIPAPPAGTTAKRSDTLQLLWMENQLRTAPEGAWTLTVMHHPVFSPRGCVFRLLGSCIGGHDDEDGLKKQLHAAWGATGPDDRSNGPFHPDLVVTAHNHFYARTHSLDGLGYAATQPGAGVRYFVTGGGGAPLYRQQPLHARYARGGSFHHFTYLRLTADTAFFWAVDDHLRVRDSGCFRKGEVLDRCIARGTFSSATLSCGDPAPADASCPVPTP